MKKEAQMYEEDAKKLAELEWKSGRGLVGCTRTSIGPALVDALLV